MTGINSPFRQDELDRAVALITNTGISKEWAQGFLAQSWQRVGIHPESAAIEVTKAMTPRRLTWPG